MGAIAIAKSLKSKKLISEVTTNFRGIYYLKQKQLKSRYRQTSLLWGSPELPGQRFAFQLCLPLLDVRSMVCSLLFAAVDLCFPFC
jgi:hypothetical protein